MDAKYSPLDTNVAFDGETLTITNGCGCKVAIDGDAARAALDGREMPEEWSAEFYLCSAHEEAAPTFPEETVPVTVRGFRRTGKLTDQRDQDNEATALGRKGGKAGKGASAAGLRTK